MANSLGPDTYGGDWGGGTDIGGGWDGGSANSLGPDTYGGDWGGVDTIGINDGGGIVQADMLGGFSNALSGIGSAISNAIGGIFGETQHSVNKESPNFAFADKTTPGRDRGYATIDKSQASSVPSNYSELAASVPSLGPAVVSVPGLGTIVSPGSIAPVTGSPFNGVTLVAKSLEHYGKVATSLV